MKYLRSIAMQNLIDVFTRLERKEETELSGRSPDLVPAPESGQEPEPQARCSDCIYWTKNPGNGGPNGLLMCAVNIPNPTEEALAKVEKRKAWAYHDCPDFEAIAHDLSNVR